jgi:hypothetical protein
MTMYEEPPIVDIDEILDEEESPEGARAGRQIVLVIGLTVIGLAGVSVLAALLLPVVGEVVRWIVVTIRFAQGS